MKTSTFLSTLSFLPLVLAACAGETDASDIVDSADAELRTVGIKEIEVGRSTGLQPLPPPGSCRVSGRYTVSFVSKTIKGDVCIGRRHVVVDRRLSADELASVREAVADVTTVAPPEACPTDVPVTSLMVSKATSRTLYVDDRSACGGALAATHETLAHVLLLAEDLAIKGQK